jgi:hypothetical protein
MVSDLQTAQQADQLAKANKRLKKLSQVLFAIAVIGQWMFVYYIVAFYGGIAVSGEYEKVNEALGHGIIKGDSMGNLMLGVHLALAVVVTFGGPLQFSAAIRKHFPLFHRWNGRIFYLTAFVVTFAGLYMIYTRGAHGGITGLLGNTLNASLIIWFSVLAWQTAIQRDFVAHKKWAIRAFLMVSGVWFFRLGYGIWILITGFTAPGTNGNLNGPFDIFLSFAHSLVPLLILEAYFYAKRHSSLRVKQFGAGALIGLSLLMIGGIVMIALVFWAPHL